MGDMADLALEIASIECSMADALYADSMDVHDAYDIGLIDEHCKGVYPVYEYSAFDSPRLHTAFERVNELEGRPSGPTCNKCSTLMPSRMGKFGRFYYCKNRCDGQKAVSLGSFIRNSRGHHGITKNYR